MTEEGDVIEALYNKGDERYVLGLLSDRRYAREVTAFMLARKPPKRACELVAKSARYASEDAIQFAFWSLTRLGNRCHAQMRALAADTSQPLTVRGMAIEVLAMMRDKRALRYKRRKKVSTYNASLARARIIYNAPE